MTRWGDDGQAWPVDDVQAWTYDNGDDDNDDDHDDNYDDGEAWEKGFFIKCLISETFGHYHTPSINRFAYSRPRVEVTITPSDLQLCLQSSMTRWGDDGQARPYDDGDDDYDDDSKAWQYF